MPSIWVFFFYGRVLYRMYVYREGWYMTTLQARRRHEDRLLFYPFPLSSVILENHDRLLRPADRDHPLCRCRWACTCTSRYAGTQVSGDARMQETDLMHREAGPEWKASHRPGARSRRLSPGQTPRPNLLIPCRHQQREIVSSFGARLSPPLAHRLVLGFLLPICQPHDRKILTTLGVTAAVSGTRMKMKLLWIA